MLNEFGGHDLYFRAERPATTALIPPEKMAARMRADQPTRSPRESRGYRRAIRLEMPATAGLHCVTSHERELQWLFDTFPDIEINEHPIKFGSGDWTAGMSVTTRTFSEPMKLADGSEISPTGKPFEIRIVTLVRWEDGRIAEEYLFWDNLDWNRQIGIAD